jgi:glycosyltransferase involved in cell wall biosynthesis
MKILVVIPSGQKEHNGVIILAKYSGVDYHRLLGVHAAMGTMAEVSQINSIENVKIEFLQEFDVLVVNRYVSRELNTSAVLAIVKESGIKLVVDLDDDYRIPDWHIFYDSYKQGGHSSHIFQGLKHADAITVTHENAALLISKETGNENVFVVPNGINKADNQFNLPKVQSKKIRFGWTGSVTHMEDVLLMHESLDYLYNSNYVNEFQFVYGGYDSSDQSGISKTILSILSCKGSASDKTFSVFPAQDVFNYGRFYTHIDVSMIPLRDNRFNRLKSNLKLLEAGHTGCAAIVSGVEPYKDLLVDKQNCLVAKNKHDWYKHMTKLINNKSLVADLAEGLKETVKDYTIENMAKRRFDIYKYLIK